MKSLVSQIRLCDVSGPRQALVRLCQRIGYGQIIELPVCEGEPLLAEATVLQDIKLDAAVVGRPENKLEDFALRSEVCRLIHHLDDIRNGCIHQIFIQHGIPRRIVIERRLTVLHGGCHPSLENEQPL